MKSIFIFGQDASVSNSPETPEKKEKVTYFDQALFRIPGKVLFYQKALESIDALKKVNCISKTPIIYQALNYKNINHELGKTPYEWRRNDQTIQMLVLLEKIKSFGLTGVGQDIDEVFNRLSKTRCRNLKLEKESQSLQELVRVEFYLQDRFVKNNKLVKDSLKTFVDSISNKSRHEILY